MPAAKAQAWLAAQARATPASSGHPSLPASCRAALELWLLAHGQWRLGIVPVAAGFGAVPVSRPVALDYLALEATARMAGIAMTPALFADLRDIEDGALEAFGDTVPRRPGH